MANEEVTEQQEVAATERAANPEPLLVAASLSRNSGWIKWAISDLAALRR